jgi:23S rRNA pseudouridine1911/1915/1917 synthase
MTLVDICHKIVGHLLLIGKQAKKKCQQTADSAAPRQLIYNFIMETRVEIQASGEHYKMRLEDFLLDHFSSLSKMYLRELVKTEKCEVNGRQENIGYRLRPNDLVEIDVDHSRGTAMRREDIPLDIIFEDEEIIVINKPAGMLMHPSHRENSGTLLNALAYYLNQSSAKQVRPGLPHRLDKQTSGLVVVAKTARAHRRLSESFMKKRITKRYIALVEGVLKEDERTIIAPIGRFADLKMWNVKDDGKHSESRLTVRERSSNTTLVELEPITGRTNQLRIHCQLIGHPIVGDVQRGGREYARLCLHANRLSFRHPLSREELEFDAVMPAEFEMASA